MIEIKNARVVLAYLRSSICKCTYTVEDKTTRVPARDTPTMDERAWEATSSMVGVSLADTLGDGGKLLNIHLHVASVEYVDE